MARRGVDYSAGASSAIATQYADLRAALAAEGEARNKQKAREIEDKGLFGSGIRQSDISDFGNIALKGAEFGEARMGRKMDRATKSFERRVVANERRLKTLQQRWKTADPDSRAALTKEMEGIEMGMGEERNKFEDLMGKYQEEGLWGTKFGGKDVGYRTGGRSQWSKDTQGGGPADGGGDGGDKRIGPREDMPVGWSPDVVPEWRRKKDDLSGGPPDQYSSYPHQREFENIAQETEGPQEGGPQLGGAFDRSGEQWSPGVSDLQASGIEGYGSGMMNLGDRGFKKKAGSGDIVAATSGGIAERGTGSNKFDPNPELGLGESRISRIGKNPARLPISGALRDRTSLQRRRDDVLEKRKLIADKEQALGQQKLEENQMIQDITNKYRRRELEDLVSGIDLN